MGQEPEKISGNGGDERLAAGMKEIAERVGVSKTTVHRALTGRGRISEATRQKILEVAQELDYTPNIVARSLRRQRTGTFGFISNAVLNSFYATLLSATEEAAATQGFSILFCCSSGRPELEREHLALLREKRVDGLLVAPAHPRANADEYERLQRAGLPFVFVDRIIPAVSTDAVMTDHRLGGQLIAEHLIAGGCRRIGMVLPAGEKNMATSVSERLDGIEDIASVHGVEMVPIGEEGYWEPMEDYASHLLGRYLDEGGKLDAVIGSNDHFAIGAMYACQSRGLRVPDDIAIVGYDDLDMAAFVSPNLTTIRQPTRQIAWEAVKLLLSRIGGSRLDGAFTIRLRPTLMERDSTRPVVRPPSLTLQHHD